MARPDLNKLLCERQRPRSKDKFRNYRHKKHVKEFDGHFITPSLIYGWDRKEFNENLNPLYGFIRSRVGQNWDDVYSELCKVFDKRSVINQHILLHLDQYVEKNTFMKDGKVWVQKEHGSWRDAHEVGKDDRRKIPIEDDFCEYYVHPETKILTHNSKTSRRKLREEREAKLAAEKWAKEREFKDGRKVKKINGCWFFVWTETKQNTCRIDGKLVTMRDEIEHKRQCSKKELKLYGLR